MVEKAVYYVRINFIEPVLGSQPADVSLWERYVRAKLDKEIERIEKALKNAKTQEEAEALQEKLDRLMKERGEECILPEVERKMTVFYRDAEGYLCLMNYQVLGYLKEMANNFLKSGFKNKFSKYVDVRANLDGRYRECYLIRNGERIKEPDGVLERPLRAMTASGYIVSISVSEIVNPPVETEFYIVVLGNKSLHGIDENVLRMLLELGKEKGGISQWRGAGYGRFEVIEFKKV